MTIRALPRRKRVLLDVDGVQADFVENYLLIASRVVGRTFRRDQVKSWGIAESLGLSKSETREVSDVITRGRFCADLDPLPGARAGVERLRRVADVYAVTTPWRGNETWAHDRTEWLAREMGFDRKHVIQAAHKHFIHGHVFVDDKLENVAAWDEHWSATPMGCVAVLWAQSYNEADDWAGIRTNDWSVIEQLAFHAAETR